MGDIRQIRELNSPAWADSLVGGMEVVLKDFKTLDATADHFYERLPYDLKIDKITDQYAQLFDWLQLLNRNVVIFLILIIFVATFNMVATIFIMILERTNMIGILKALGATDNQIRRMFFFRGLSLTVRGMLIGNAIAVGVLRRAVLLPHHPARPRELLHGPRADFVGPAKMLLILNAATFAASLLAVLIPTYLISRIKPVVAIKFD